MAKISPTEGKDKETKSKKDEYLTRIKTSRFLSLTYYKFHASYYLLLIIYILVSIALAIIQYFHYEREYFLVILTRICGMLLNFNCGLIILLVLRHLQTLLRNFTVIRNNIPFDSFISLHKACATVIIILSFCHTIIHCINFFVQIKKFAPINEKEFDDFVEMELFDQIIEEYIGNRSSNAPIDPENDLFSGAAINFDDYDIREIIKGLYEPNIDYVSLYFELLFTRKSNIGWVYFSISNYREKT